MAVEDSGAALRRSNTSSVAAGSTTARVPLDRPALPLAAAARAPARVTGCRRAATRAFARPMLPDALAPLDPHKTRALTTIYAPRKLKIRKNKTAQNRMLENDLPVKSNLSPFHTLPAIGTKSGKTKPNVILFDLNKNERTDLETTPMKLHDMLKPLTPLRIHGFVRKNSLELSEKPQQLLRENTYDLIEPVILNSVKVKKRDTSLPRRKLTPKKEEEVEKVDDEVDQAKVSPKTRFKKAAMQVAKLSSTPEKLLCLRERQQTFVCLKDENKSTCKATCKLQDLPQSPSQNLNKLSEIFQTLEMKGRHRDKMKKENSWF